MKRFSLKNSLRFLAFVLWSYTPVFIITMLGLSFPQHSVFKQFSPEVRGEYRWDFELMFASIFLVWGWYLWQASKEPKKHVLFIDFSIWANIFHGVVMVLIGILRKGEFHHLLSDGLVLVLPAMVVLYLKKKELND